MVGRCPYVATDPLTTRHPREDGWRCGLDADHNTEHVLYNIEGTAVLYAGAWVLALPTETITIPRPHVPYGPKHLSGDESDVKYLRRAADDLEGFYKPFGTNLRATIVKLVRDAADAIEEGQKS